MSRITLAVATRDRARNVERFLLPLARAARERGHEILVVDQSEGPETADLIAIEAGVRYLRSAPGLSRARNVAIRESSTPFVAIADDDVTAGPFWLDRISRLFDEHPEAGAVCGRVLDGRGCLLPGAEAGVYERPTHPFRLGTGCNVAFRREALAEAGLFDEQLGAGTPFYAAEETDLLYRIQKAGWSVVCSDDITVVHENSCTGEEERRLHFGYGFGAGAQTAKHVQAGDARALFIGIRESMHHLRVLAWAVVKCRPRTAALQLPFLHGFLRGFLARWRLPTSAASARTAREAGP